MAIIIITNSLAAIAVTYGSTNSLLRWCIYGWCATANYFGRSNAIDYTVAINNQPIGSHSRCTLHTKPEWSGVDYVVKVLHSPIRCTRRWRRRRRDGSSVDRKAFRLPGYNKCPPMATCDQISLQCEAVGQLIPRRPLGVLLIRGSITQPEEDRRVLLERGARPIDLSTFKDQRSCQLTRLLA